jgi:hypothetical protein
VEDKVPKDDPEFQGLENENNAATIYPDVSTELPGVMLKNNDDCQSLHVVPLKTKKSTGKLYLFSRYNVLELVDNLFTTSYQFIA